MEIDFTEHASLVIAARGIPREWVLRAVETPEYSDQKDDGTRHFLLRIPECDDRVLRVVVNAKVRPPCVITVFFDRRMKGRMP